jgi:glycosyltransferase involved in cell wall biosynthesis
MRHTGHNVRLFPLDGRFWKWRMQGGALELAPLVEAALAAESAVGPPDAILCTDMLNLPSWLALLRGKLPARIPVLLYMHENQLTYPWRPGEKVDLTYAMINWLSQCCAQGIAFNSQYHLDAWFAALPNLLKHFPDYNQLQRIAEVRERCCVLPVGIESPTRNQESKISPQPATDPLATAPLILWNQRWEYDKRPDRFFALLYRLAEEEVPFQLAVAGENFRNVPKEFDEAHTRLMDRVVHWGYAPDRSTYDNLLASADLVISTADHEFFGISILEAVAAGATPLLPNRLSYPELFPQATHTQIIYEDETDLYEKARRLLLKETAAPLGLAQHVSQTYGWNRVANQYDRWITSVTG